MTFVRSKTGIAVLLLLIAFGFLYFFSGAFGGTFIGLTLNSNKSLQEGLVAHYTFDGKDVDVSSTTAEVADASGNDNKGNFIGEAFGEMLWATTTDPGSAGGEGYAIATDNNGDVYVTGGCESGCGVDVANYTYKIDGASGNMLWATSTSAGTGWDYPFGIATDDSGNVYVTGTCDGGCGASWTHYTYKIDGSNGDMLWATTTDPAGGGGEGYAIATDSSGNLFVAGVCWSGCGSGQTHYTYKIDGSNGDMLWATTTDPGSGNDKPYAIATDISGNVYVTGYCQSGCGASWTHYTYKIDGSNGDMLWATTTDPSSGNDSARGIATDSRGNVYVTGSCWTGCGSGATHYTYKIDPSNGDMLWATTTDPSTGGDHAYAITTDSSGYVYVTGYTDNEACGGGGTDSCNYTYKIDPSNGDMLWATTTDPSTGNDHAYAITTDSSGHVYVTGYGASISSCGGFCHYTYKIRADTYAKDAVTLGNIGQGMEFDGVDDYIEPSSNVLTGDSGNTWAVAWWSRSNSTTGQGIIGEFNDTDNSIQIRPSTNEVSVKLTDYSNALIVTDVYNQDEWRHYTVTRDGTLFSLYVDGQVHATSVNSGTFTWDESGPNYIGKIASSIEFSGELDDFRVYDRSLSADEVSRIYGLGATTKISKTLDSNPDLENGLEMHWTFDGPKMDWSSTTAEVRDSSMNAIKGNADTFIESAPGVIGQGIEFQGSTWKEVSAIDDNDDIILGTGDMTIAGWLRSDEEMTIGTEPVIISNRTGSNGYNLYYEPQFSDFRVAVGSTTGGTLYDSNTFTLETGEWNHITAVIDRDKGVLFYINGEFINRAGTSAYDGENITNNSAKLGSFDNNVSLASYDDVRIYSRALSTSTIKRLYELGATTKVSKTLNTNPDLENGLVGHWTFDGPDMDIGAPTAEVLDRSGNGNTGDWQNHATTTTFGVVGQAIEFDGVDDYINFGSPSSLDDIANLSMCVWVQPNTCTNDCRIFVKDDGTGNNGVTFIIDQSTPHIEYRQGYTADGYWKTDSGTVVYGEWMHVCVTHDTTSSAIAPLFYLDGESVNVVESQTPSGSPDVDASYIAYVGNRLDLARPFDGKMDDLRVYNRILSEDEILRLYQLGN